MMDIILGEAAKQLRSLLSKTADEASKEKKTYTEKLEQATGDAIFKYILLINVSALEGYVAQTRIQAEQSFNLSKIVAVIGFIILAIGIGIGIYQSLGGGSTLDAAYLAAVAGIITEFISGIFFYLYNRTLQQINRFHDKLVAMEQTSMSFLVTSLVVDQVKRDDAKVALSRDLISVVSNKGTR